MAQFFSFLAEQWMLTGMLAAAVFLLIQHESRKGGKTLSPQQLVSRVNAEEAVVVDVRDEKEFKKGHIVDSLNIPHNKMADRWTELEKYREKPVILVCNLGHHSGPAGKTLAANGFTDISRLSGGMAEWKNMQLPLVVA
jgi:rhodanese-related sulfurtransferase